MATSPICLFSFCSPAQALDCAECCSTVDKGEPSGPSGLLNRALLAGVTQEERGLHCPLRGLIRAAPEASTAAYLGDDLTVGVLGGELMILLLLARSRSRLKLVL